MGWTFFPSHGRSTREILTNEVEYTKERGSLRVKDYAERGSTAYILLEYRPTEPSEETVYVPDADGTVRIVGVYLTRRVRDAYDFGYKDMDETAGPYECKCPLRILNAASPLRDDYTGHARDFRNWVRAYHAAQAYKRKHKPRPGQRIKLPNPVTFSNGVSSDTFDCVSIKRRGRNRVLYTIPGQSGLYQLSTPTVFEVLNANTMGDSTAS